MPPPAKRPRRWPRRVAYALGAVALLLLVAAVVTWWNLPRIVHSGFMRGTTAAGFEEAAIEVERADLSGLRVEELHVRKGGLDVRLEAGAAEYSIGDLSGGQVERLTIHGLTVSLDFTQPRRGLLPDAIGELLAQIPSSDDPLVWPVTELALENCRLVLVFPNGPQEFAIHGSATREPDGRVAFTLRSEHPGQSFEVSGAVRTETMDGEVAVTRLSLDPAFALAVAEQLGIWKLPESLKLETNRVDLTAKATLRAGAAESYSAHLETSRAAVTTGDIAGSATALKIDIAQSPDGNLVADVRANLEGRGSAQSWSLAPTGLRVALDRGKVSATLTPAAVAWGDQASAKFALVADVGVPALGGSAGANVKLDVTDATAAGMHAAPFSLEASGWTDRVELSATTLGLAEQTPGTLSDLTVVVQDPLGAAPSVDLSARINATEHVTQWLPEGWRVEEPTLPTTVLQLRGNVGVNDTGVRAKLDLEGAWPKAIVTAGDARFTCAPTANVNLALENGSVSFAAALEAKEIENSFPKFPPGVRGLRVACEVPATPLNALTELAAGRVPKDELAAKVSATVFQSETRGDAYVAVRHFGATSEWTTEVWGMLDNVSGAWGGAEVSGLRAEVTVDSGRLADARVGEWLQVQDWVPLGRSTLPQTKVDISVTAASVERHGVARSEWAGFWVQKLRATENRPPLEARVKFTTGVLRSGPETIVQPEVDLNLLGTLDDFAVETSVKALVEGTPLALAASPRVKLDWNTLSASAAGAFKLEPITLTNSDVVTRWAPEQKGIAITATVAADGTFSWSSAGDWDGTANLSLTNSTINIPDQGLRVEGINTALAFSSLRELRTEQQQPFSFARLAIGKIEVTNAAAKFSAEGMNRVAIDALSARVFGGEVSVGSFALVFPAPDVGIALEFEGVDAGELMRQVEIFKGTISGKLRGKLPIGLLAGRPYFGEGFLELDPRFPARFSMDARGLFTTDLPNVSTKDKVVRLPYEVLEEALGDVVIETMRLDFFRREEPGTPIRIQFSGVSDTRRARVPLNITTRVNGSIPEALNFLFRLATL